MGSKINKFNKFNEKWIDKSYGGCFDPHTVSQHPIVTRSDQSAHNAPNDPLSIFCWVTQFLEIWTIILGIGRLWGQSRMAQRKYGLYFWRENFCHMMRFFVPIHRSVTWLSWFFFPAKSCHVMGDWGVVISGIYKGCQVFSNQRYFSRVSSHWGVNGVVCFPAQNNRHLFHVREGLTNLWK